MTKQIVLQLGQTAKNKGFKSWDEIKNYVNEFAKYDDLTLRDIDDALDIARKD